MTVQIGDLFHRLVLDEMWAHLSRLVWRNTCAHGPCELASMSVHPRAALTVRHVARRPWQVRSGQVRSGQVRSGQVRSGELRRVEAAPLLPLCEEALVQSPERCHVLV